MPQEQEIIQNPMQAIEDMEETIAYRMKVVRTSLKLNRKEFAAKIGVYPNRITEVEQGKYNISLKMLTEIGKLGFDLNWLVNGNNKEKELQAAIGDDVELFKLLNKIKRLEGRDLRFLSGVIDALLENYHK